MIITIISTTTITSIPIIITISTLTTSIIISIVTLINSYQYYDYYSQDGRLCFWNLTLGSCLRAAWQKGLHVSHHLNSLKGVI